MTQTGATETMRSSVVDPDGDEVILRAGNSMLGVRPIVSGPVITYPAPTGRTGKDGFALTRPMAAADRRIASSAR